MDILRSRLYTQRLTGPSFATPEEVVRFFGAVQAQEYTPSLWALGLRLPAGITEQTVKQAVVDRKILRTWPMRGTIHYVPAEDAGWMTLLLARRINKKYTTMLQNMGLTEDVLAVCHAALVRSLEGGKQLIRKELYADLERAGIADANKRGMFVLSQAAQAGLIAFGPHREKQPTFVLLEEWVKQKQLEGDEALAEITRRYVTGHGPATERDFSWWSGLTLSEVRRGLTLVEGDFSSEVIDGQTYWFAPIEHELPPAQSVHLLPCFDEFTVGYKDRSAAIPTDRLFELGYGVNNNNLMINGFIAGMWKRTISKDGLTVTITLLRPLDATERAALQEAFERFAAFVELKPADLILQ